VEAAHTIQTATLDGHPIWDRGIHGEGQVIGVLDTGPPDVAHCFFAGPAPNTPGPGHRKLVAVRNASPPAPLNGHATFVAAIAAGDDRNLPGSSNRRGGAWAARLVCGNRVDLNLPGNTLLNELTQARLVGAVIHSNSWHRNTNPAALPVRGLPAAYGLLDRDVDNFTFANEDHLVVGSAGNTGEELGPPGTAKNALCVGAAQAEPSEMNLGDGNPGPTADGRRKPDIMAVGCGIQSAIVSTACTTGPRNPCASSYATPHAAAAAALVRQYFLDGWYPSGEKIAANSVRPTGALLKAVLLNSTQDMTGVGVAGYPSNAEGWGLIRLDRTLFFRGARRRLRVWDERHAGRSAMPAVDFLPHDFDVADESEQLKVTLVWSDPGLIFPVFFGPPTVNDLNLEVTAPDGTTYVGNDFTGGVSTPNGATRDALNNVEMVVVNNPPPGRWQLLVHGTVNMGNPGQGYALVATANLKSKCFVASAVYGDDSHPDVRLMRSWRDRTLAGGGVRATATRGLVAVYERVGPRLAEAVRSHPRAAGLLRERMFGPAAAAARRRRERRLQATRTWARVGSSRGRRE
jgi:hypothetical protein